MPSTPCSVGRLWGRVIYPGLPPTIVGVWMTGGAPPCAPIHGPIPGNYLVHLLDCYPVWSRSGWPLIWQSAVPAQLFLPLGQLSLGPWPLLSPGSLHFHLVPLVVSMRCQGYCTSTRHSCRCVCRPHGKGDPWNAAWPPGPSSSQGIGVGSDWGSLPISWQRRDLLVITLGDLINILHWNIERGQCTKSNGIFLQDMGNASGGPYVPGLVCHCPLYWPDDTLLDHCLQVVILDMLDLVVPLLKRHLSLPRSGITTKDVNSGGVYPQPGCEHAEKVADIHIGPRGTYGLLHRLAMSPSTPHSEAHFPIIHFGFTATPWDPQTALGWPVWGCCLLPPSYLHLESLQHLP